MLLPSLDRPPIDDHSGTAGRGLGPDSRRGGTGQSGDQSTHRSVSKTTARIGWGCADLRKDSDYRSGWQSGVLRHQHGGHRCDEQFCPSIGMLNFELAPAISDVFVDYPTILAVLIKSPPMLCWVSITCVACHDA